MSKLKVISILLLSILLTVAQATDSHAQLHNFEIHEKSFRCTVAKQAAEELNDLDDQKFFELMDDEIVETELALDSDQLKKEEKRILKTHYKLLQSIRDNRSSLSDMKKFYLSLCLNGEPVLKSGFKALAHATHVIGQGFSIPFRYLFRYIQGRRGLIKRKGKALTLTDAFSHRARMNFSLFLLYQGAKAAAGSNPLILPFYTIGILDTLSIKACELPELLSEKDQEFCKNYHAIKDGFADIAEQGRLLGAKQHKPKSADPVWTLGKITDENYCEWLYHEKQVLKPEQIIQTLNETWVGITNPAAMAYPKSFRFPTKIENLRSDSTKNKSRLKNIIISLSPPEDVVEKMISTGSFQRYKAFEKELNQLNRVDERLFRIEKVEKCLEKKKEWKFSLADFMAKQKEITNYKNEAFYSQHLIIEKQYKRLKSIFNVSNRLKLNWELKPSITLNSLSEILASADTGNVIVVTHSLENNKKMIDSVFQSFPTTYFSKFSPSLQSLSFFTCEDESFIKTYELGIRLDSSPTIHPERVLNFVDNRGLLGDRTRAPIHGFSDFLSKVDRITRNSLKESLLSDTFHPDSKQVTPQKSCTLEITGLKISTGSMGASLNRMHLGTTDAKENNGKFVFDCAYLKESNRLKIHGVSMLDQLKFEKIPAGLLVNGVPAYDLKQENFFNQSGEYSNSIFEFRGEP